MPEPPHQPDMRSQGQPPRRGGVVTGFVQGSPAILLVISPQQLPAALQQHEKPVVIENSPANARLAQDFERLLRWQRWKDTNRLLLIGALVLIVLTQMVITNRYGLEASWYVKWKPTEIGGKITLTPFER